MSGQPSILLDNRVPTDGASVEARRLAGADLADALRNSRANTWACVQDLTDAQWLPPRHPGINPIAWELGHLAWFAEYWILRAPHQRDDQGFAASEMPPRFAGPDATFDSARLAHTCRWSTTLPTRAQVQDLMQAQLEACIGAIPAANPERDATQLQLQSANYFHRLALLHEDMHAEALRWLRFKLGYSAPEGLAPPQRHPPGRLDMVGGPVVLGVEPHAAAQTGGFSFDNEIGTRQVTLAPFSIDAAPVTAGEFCRFVESGGYNQPDYWPGAAGQWRASSPVSHPDNWRQAGAGGWQHRWFDQYLPLEPDAPAIHINAFEAEAYCRWAQRRLPTAGEWEFAAGHSQGFHWGQSVWEWTSSTFEPYNGFTPGPYREYSKPWFGDHRELRGGAYATHARMHNRRYRNFFLPQRSDIFAGFRTVTL